MKRNDFLQLVSRFSGQPVPATIHRHVYVWVGEEDDLLSKSPVGLFKVLDLHQLCRKLEKIPYGDKAAGRELLAAIEDWISREFPRDQRQRGLLVTGINLLYRYRLSLNVLVRLANENCMVILALSDLDVEYIPAKALPSYVQFSPEAVMKYVGTELSEEAIVREG
jgi:hypothetical protein